MTDDLRTNVEGQCEECHKIDILYWNTKAKMNLCSICDYEAKNTRSILRRKAALAGESAPEFDKEE